MTAGEGMRRGGMTAVENGGEGGDCWVSVFQCEVRGRGWHSRGTGGHTHHHLRFVPTLVRPAVPNIASICRPHLRLIPHMNHTTSTGKTCDGDTSAFIAHRRLLEIVSRRS
jgi:hypothetical protein